MEWIKEVIWNNDMLQNILAEALGIFITVYLIDRFNKRREERRWLPSKHLLYAKLIHQVTRLMRETIPYGLWKRSRTVYCFGQVRAMASIEFENSDMFEVDTRIYQTIKDEGQFDTKPLSKYQTNFENILDSYAHIIEPELLEYLLKLEANLTSLSKNTIDWKNETEIKLFSVSLRGALVNASQIGLWLEKQASQRISREEFAQEFKEKTQELKKDISEVKKEKARNAKNAG